MKKKLNILPILGLAIIALLIVVFVVPVGTGIVGTSAIVNLKIPAYDIVFGNETINNLNASSATIAAFTLLVIGAVFQLVAFILCLPNPEGSKKFSGFLFFVGGLCEIVTGAIYLAAVAVTKELLPPGLDYNLAWAFIVSGAVALVTAVVSIGTGVIAFGKKSK